jgi:hypothetical protein
MVPCKNSSAAPAFLAAHLRHVRTGAGLHDEDVVAAVIAWAKQAARITARDAVERRDRLLEKNDRARAGEDERLYHGISSSNSFAAGTGSCASAG